MQLFYKTESSIYNEINSLIKKHEPGSQQVVFKLNDLSNIEAVRFDPLNDWVHCTCGQIELYNNSELLAVLNPHTHNATEMPDGTLFFATHDPQVFFNLGNYKNSSFNKVVVAFHYLKVGSECKMFFAENPGLFFSKLLPEGKSHTHTDNSFSALFRQLEEKMIHAKNLVDDFEITKRKHEENEKLSQHYRSELQLQKEQNVEYEKQIIDLSESINKKKDENGALHAIVQAHSETIGFLENEKRNLQSTIDALNNEKEKLETALFASFTDNETLKVELAGIRNELNIAQNENKTLLNDVKSKDNRLSQLQLELNKHIRTIDELNISYKELNLELQNKEKQMQEERNRLEQELKNTNDTLKRLMANERNKLVRSYHRLLPLRLAGNLLRFMKKPLQYYRMRRDTLVVRRSGLFDDAWYLQQYPDLYLTTVDMLQHYMLYGAAEGRNPNPMFDANYYLNENPDVKNAGINPLLHYALYGKAEGRKPKAEESNQFDNQYLKEKDNLELKETIQENEIRIIKESGFFDIDFYYESYPDVKNTGVDALEHYYFNGWKEGRNPSSDFDTNFYLNNYLDIKECKVNPLYHFVAFGKNEGRMPKSSIFNNDSIVYEDRACENVEKQNFQSKLIAFYLPQFHPIPENDEWWGKGFTEWQNVAKASPQYPGHYQPHIPADLGFYDLRLPEVMEQQIKMAREFGIFGFCIYYYWFDGKRLLEKPLEMLYNHPEWDMNYSVCWANENWTRRWDGMESEILIGQNHSDKDDLDFIKDVSKYFKDNRYIKVDNKPLLVIYRPGLFPNIKRTAKQWRNYCKQNLGTDVFLAMVQGFGNIDPNEYGFDAAIEFPPHNFNLQFLTEQFNAENFEGHIVDTLKIISDSKGKINRTDYDLMRGVMLAWDNTPRRDNKSHIYLNNTPTVYEQWLREAINDTLQKKNNKHPFVFINAWNEWAEGCHLEPDKKYGYAYLNATQRALLKAENKHNNKLSNAENVFI